MVSIYRYIVRRLLLLIPTAFLALTAIFFLFNVLPGDAALVYVGFEARDAATLAQVRHMLGLDVPVLTRYFIWLNNVLHFNLGNSLLSGESISSLLIQALPVTLLLTFMAASFAIIIGLSLGVIAALKRNTRYDFIASIISLLGVSTPTFWIGLMLILLFSVRLGWLPPGGFLLTTLYSNPLRGLAAMILPAITLSGWMAGNIARITRSSMLEVLPQEYVLTARAKGLPERVVILKHALKNAMIPILTVTGLQIASLVGGAVITEDVFRIPGLGQLVLHATLNRDFPVVEGVILVVVVLLIFVNLGVDLLYKYVDPRIRLE